MTERTSLGEPSGNVIRICGRLKVLQMAANASGRADVVIVVDVTIGALPRRHGVPAGQGKSHRAVVEVYVDPVICSVATLAISRKIGRCVIGVAGGLEILGVAGKASRGHGLKLAAGCPLVAGVAVQRRMRSGQGKTVDVLLNLLGRNLPSPHGVALLAIRSQLSSMNVGVAVLAALSHTREHWPDVALRATDPLVHAA